MKSSVSVVIPSWNRADLLRAVLPSLRTQTRRPDEVLVVENGSCETTRNVAHEYGAEVVELKRNLGFAGAVNEGIRRAKGEWILLANNDVVFRPCWLETLLDSAQREGVLFATGKLLQTSDVKTIDGTWDMVSRAAHAWRCGYGRPDGAPWSHLRRIWTAPMTAAIYHRSVFERVGLLDTRFEAYYEDVDFGIRCGLHGIEGIYEPSAVAIHRGKSTFGKNDKRVMYLTARNQVLLLAKHYSPKTLRRFAWPIVVGQTLALAGAARQGHLVSALQGKMDGVRRWATFRSDTPLQQTEESERFENALADSEREIREMQEEIGFDPYWKIYFSLVRPG